MSGALVAVRAVHFCAVATLFGGATCAAALRRRQAAVLFLLRTAALVAAAGGIAWFAMVFTDVTDSVGALVDADMWHVFLGAPFGLPWLARLALCAAAVVTCFCRVPLPFALLGACFAIDQAWLGHAATGSGSEAVTQIAFYWTHVLGGFLWVGALVLICVLAIAEKGVPADALALFSWIGPTVVAAIVASGIANAALRGIGFASLIASQYGRLLDIKLLLVAAMLALAVRHRRISKGADMSGRLRGSVAAETFLGLAVLVAAAVLGITPPE